MIIICMFLQCCFQNFFCSILFPKGILLPLFGNISPSSLQPNNSTFIKTSERVFGDALTLAVLRQLAVTLEFRIILYLNKPSLSFPFYWIKSLRVLVFLILSVGDCVGAFLLEPHLAQYLSCSPSSSPHEGQMHDTLPSILNWLDAFLLCVARVRIHKKSRFLKT